MREDRVVYVERYIFFYVEGMIRSLCLILFWGRRFMGLF